MVKKDTRGNSTIEDIKNGAVDLPIVKCVHIILSAHDINGGAGKSAARRNFLLLLLCSVCVCANTQLCIQSTKLGARNKKKWIRWYWSTTVNFRCALFSALQSLMLLHKGILLFVITCTISCQVYSESIACLLFCEDHPRKVLEKLRADLCDPELIWLEQQWKPLVFPWNSLILELHSLCGWWWESQNSEMCF